MHSSRVALVTPTFWPVGSRLLETVIEFATVLKQLGTQVTIFTERTEPSWSPQIEFRESKVIRVDRPVSRPWSRGRYGKQLESAMRRTSSNWDAIIVFGAGEELVELAGAQDLTRQLIVRLNRIPNARNGVKAIPKSVVAAIESCAAVIGSSAQVELGLRELEAEPAQFWLVPETAVAVGAVGPYGGRREQARSVLSDMHPLLHFERQQPLVVTVAPLDEDEGVMDAIEAWRLVRRRAPRAQMIFGGDGPMARAVWSRVQELHLGGGVHLPGWFDDWTDLFAAADLYLHPLRSETSCPMLAKALALGIPAVISRAEPITREMEHPGHAWLFRAGSPKEMSEGIYEVLAGPELRRNMSMAAAQFMRLHRSRELLFHCFSELLQIQPQETCTVGS